MGYDIFKFGTLNLNDKIQSIPLYPTNNGDIPRHDGKAIISLEASALEKCITWIKPIGQNILIADRILLVNISWKNLDENGFIVGRPVLIDGQLFCCRLPHVGENENAPNEWDEVLDEIGEDNTLWHWDKMYFFGAELSTNNASICAVRGYFSARTWGSGNVAYGSAAVGFRPVLEPLPSYNPTPNINLDGTDFHLSSLPGSNGFCPILQSIQKNVFRSVPNGNKVRMYTFVENGHPIHMDEQIKDIAKLTLTDRYYGDEFLVPWVISNGMAVVSQSLKQQT